MTAKLLLDAPRDRASETEIAETLARLTARRCKEWRVYVFASISSTMDAARQAAAACSVENPGLVLARRQLKGRGRSGRSWEESPDALYCTTIFIAKSMQDGAFALAAACAAADLLTALGCTVRLKWPNDIVTMDGLKLGGILMEAVPVAGGSALLTGVGINLKEVPDCLAGQAACVADACGRAPESPDIGAALAAALFQAWLDFGDNGFSRYRRRWLEYAAHIGKQVEVSTSAGVLRGVYEGVDQDGALVLLDGSERITVRSGDLLAGAPGLRCR